VRVAHLDTGRDWRGGQGQVLLLMRELRSRGIGQRLLAPRGPLLDRAAAAGFETVEWSSRGEIDPVAAVGAWRALRAFAPQVAHLHSAHAHALGTWPARAAGVPAVVVSRRVDFAVRGNPFSRFKYAMPVDRYLCISEGVRAVMLAAGVPESRLALVRSGIDLEAVRDAGAAKAPALREWLGLPADAAIVGTVASLAPHKNHALLLEAVPRVLARRPAARFVWLGEGECRPALERRRAELGLEAAVKMPGFREDARALLTQFDLFVLSSHLEGLCTSLLDAQALGVPIVATAVGGVPEVVQDGVTGRLVRALEPEALAGAIVEALDQPGLRAGWSRAAAEAVRRFGVGATADATLAAYESALAGRQEGARSGR
jgi:glycosyltransferase involved in cell wall biosynthesis